MNKKNLYLNSRIKLKKFKDKSLKDLSTKFDRIFLEIKHDIKKNKKTLNVLDDDFKFNFKIKDLHRFKKFKTIALIGMGGSILGAEAIYNFFQTKIKKKFISSMILMKKKYQTLRKEIYHQFFLLSFLNLEIL